MNNVKDFILAALPWVIIGLAIAMIGANAAKNKKVKEEHQGDGEKPESGSKDKKSEGNFMAEGMSIGMCMGVALASATHMNLAYGISFGMLIGMAIGSGIRKK